ncbi:dihydroorotase [Marinobacterium arenosum]|uniref:dihydroorotase n=1 Tax=Marinobacterium arenosum TaxID=2862496 RepID=UPI001C9693FD|nr:dihydroorotase [Marinobacterium arenosum]MBY4676271.1 dihydroorotase [Marinobacterium arenosum]
MADLLITNALVVNEDQQQELDILIRDGRIEKIGSDLQGESAKQVIDARGKVLLPGMIDDQVHFREPGVTYKADITTESRAAVAGGITSFMEMPNVKPPTLTLAALEEKFDLAAAKSAANYSFYLGASNDNLEVIKQLDPDQACGVKVFMGASTGNMLVDNIQTLEGIFREAPGIVVTHCEDTPMIAEIEARYRAQYGDNIPVKYHPEIRSREACYKSSSLAVDLAKKFGTQLHVLHLTTAEELALFQAGPVKDKQITLEACVHHLFFSEEDYLTKGSQIKCNPSIKSASDRAALLQAVNDDVIDIIATDHAPHTWEEKQEESYFKAPAGLPLVQHALLSLLDHHANGTLSLEKIVRKTSHNVTDRYKLIDRGYIREGYWADLVLVDLNTPYTVTRDNVLYKCGWSPFESHTFKASIDTTIVNGQVVYQDGKLIERGAIGKRLQFDR